MRRTTAADHLPPNHRASNCGILFGTMSQKIIRISSRINSSLIIACDRVGSTELTVLSTLSRIGAQRISNTEDFKLGHSHSPVDKMSEAECERGINKMRTEISRRKIGSIELYLISLTPSMIVISTRSVTSNNP
jgi:hypothetical protein